MPNVNPETVATLKRKMAGGPLGEVMDYYYEQFWDDNSYLKLGRPMSPPEDLQHAITRAVARLLGEATHVIALVAIDLTGTGLVHGTIVVGDAQGLFIWAPELLVIVMCLAHPGTDMSQYVRVTMTPVSDLDRVN